uniref:Uncharacterized protein n=1 Tax=Trichogramma kaykai TaxID=54128 RepID=A0ABD2WUA9_9HYME
MESKKNYNNNDNNNSNNPTCFLWASVYIRRDHESCRLYCIFTTFIDHSLCKCVVCCKRIVYVTSNAKRTR